MTVLKKISNYWMKFAALLGKINSVIILTIVFVVVVGLYALLRKGFVFLRSLFKRSTLENSFWVDKKVRPATIEELKRQF